MVAWVVGPSKIVRTWTRLKGMQRVAKELAGKRPVVVGRRQSPVWMKVHAD
jgi:hypothetical protein